MFRTTTMRTPVRALIVRGALLLGMLISVSGAHALTTIIDAPAPGTVYDPGQVFTVFVRAVDGTAIDRIQCTLVGVETQTATYPSSPPILSQSESFTFTIPPSTAPGTVLTIQAVSRDLFGSSAPVSITVEVAGSLPVGVLVGDNDVAYLFNPSDATIQRWNIATESYLTEWSIGSGAVAMAVNNAQDRVYIGYDDNTITYIAFSGGGEQSFVTAAGAIAGMVAFDSYLFVSTGSGSQTFRTYSSAGTQVDSRSSISAGDDYAWDPVHARMFYLNGTTLKYIEIAGGNFGGIGPAGTFTGLDGPLFADPDGEIIVTANGRAHAADDGAFLDTLTDSGYADAAWQRGNLWTLREQTGITRLQQWGNTALSGYNFDLGGYSGWTESALGLESYGSGNNLLVVTYTGSTVNFHKLESAANTSPDVSSIPDVTVGDAGDPGNYVAEDIVNLAARDGGDAWTGLYAVDDYTPLNELIWSFVESTDTYAINGVDTWSGSKVNPPTASQIQLGTTPGSDSTGYTMSFEVKNPGDVDGGDANPQLGRTVTFYASDGTLAGSGYDAMVYTLVDGLDSTADTPAATYAASYGFDSGDEGWSFVDASSGAITGQSTGGALQLTAPSGTSGSGLASWQSPAGELFDLVPGAVYRVRADVGALSANQNPPVMDFIFTNRGAADIEAYFAYWADYWFVPRPDIATPSTVMGPSGAFNPSGISTVSIYFTPPCVNSSSWSSFISNPAYDDKVDFQITWRVLDNVLPFMMSDLGGAVLLQNLSVTRIDVDDIEEDTVVFGGSNIGSGFTISLDKSGAAGINGTVSGGSLPISGSMGAGGFEQYYVIPGAGGDQSDLSSASYPITWQDDTLLKFTVNLQGTGSAPADALRMMMQSGDFELLAESNVSRSDSITGSAAPTMPPTSATDYVAFFYTHNASASATYRRLRPFLNLFSLNSIFGGGTSGGLTIDSFVVHEAIDPIP